MFDGLFSQEGRFARFMNLLWSLIVTSALWIVCSLPIVTAGAATAAAYYAVAKTVRFHTGSTASEFFRCFKQNLRQSLPVSIGLTLALALVVVEAMYLYSDASVPLWFLYVFYLMALLLAALGIYLWPCLSRFQMGNMALLRMGVVLMFRYLHFTLAFLLGLGALLAGLWLMPWGLPLFPGLAVYLETFLMERVLIRCSPKPEEGSPEAKKWYYHVSGDELEESDER